MKHLFFLVLVTFGACHKQPIELPVTPSPPPDPPKNFEVVWMTSLSQDTSTNALCDDACLVNGDLMYARIFDGTNEVVHLLDGQTGQRKWAKSDPAEWGDGGLIGMVDSWQDIGLVNSWSDIHAFQQSTGALLWHTDVGTSTTSGMPRMRVIGNYVYQCHRPKGSNVASAHLARAPVDTGMPWDTLFSNYRIDNGGYSPSFEMPEMWLAPDGDTLLIFQNRQVNFAETKGRIDLYALNLRTREVIWKRDNLVPEENSIINPPLVWDGKVYFIGVWRVFCLEAATGKLLYTIDNSQDHTNNFVSRPQIYSKPGSDLLILETGYGNFIAYQAKTGQKVWTTKEDYGWDKDFAIYKDRIYASGADGFLSCINAGNGALVWQEHPPAQKMGYPGARFSYGGVLLNPDLGYLYVNDGVFWYCLKVP